jgi:hypothetical protein
VTGACATSGTHNKSAPPIGANLSGKELKTLRQTKRIIAPILSPHYRLNRPTELSVGCVSRIMAES